MGQAGDWTRRRWLQRGPAIGLAAAGTVGLVPAVAAGAEPAGRVVASFSILADMTRWLAPAAVEVTSLVGPDADAHVFEPTPSAARRLAQADLVVTNGLGFEGWIDRLVRLTGSRATVVVATRGIPPRRTGGPGWDPHAWQDMGHAQVYVQRIATALAERWPAWAAEIEQRRSAYVARLLSVESQVRQVLSATPREQRRAITSHDAFGYFGDAYGIDFLAPQGWNTDSEPSAAAVAQLIRQIRQQQVRAIFIENISSARVIERIAQEAGARVGGRLYSDALSAAGGPASTYLDMMAHNARTLAAALKP